MKITQLETFVVVAEELHFRRAAERLYTQPSSVSTQISQLEAEYGTPLFTRNSRNVALTPAGETLLEKARDVLASVDALERTARTLAADDHHELIVGTMDEGIAELTAVVHDNYAIRHPNGSLKSIALDYDEMAPALANGTVDVQITVAPDNWFDPTKTIHTPLFAEGLAAVLPVFHPHASLTQVSAAQLLDEIFVHVDEFPEPVREVFMLTNLRPARADVDASISADHMHNLLNQVAAGVGMFVATHGVARFYPRPDIAYVPVTDLDPVTVYISHRRDEQRPHVLAYIEECVNAVRNSLDLIPTATDVTQG